MNGQRAAGRPAPGLTLIEVAIALAVLAIVMAVAVPAMGQQLARQRLKAAAETLASDLSEARFEAARQGRSLHLSFGTGADWCYAVATAPGCDCHNAQPCQLKTVKAADLPGIVLLDSRDASFDPGGAAQGGTTAVWRTRQGEQLSVHLTPLGRTRVCTPEGSLGGYARC